MFVISQILLACHFPSCSHVIVSPKTLHCVLWGFVSVYLAYLLLL